MQKKYTLQNFLDIVAEKNIFQTQIIYLNYFKPPKSPEG